MIADLDASELDELPQYDLCIVGSGPAGMSVACELAGRGLAIAILESGRRRPTRHGDRLREVQSEGLFVKAYSRERVFGGASTTWAGLSSPLDPIDFERRPWLGGVPSESSGWPIPRAELDGYYAEAAARYRFPGLDAFARGGFEALRAKGDRQPEWRALEEKVFLAAADPQDFAREHADVVERDDVDLWLDATVLRLEGAPGVGAGAQGRVHSARVRTRSGREHDVRAGVFVIATGGIENARLLLQSTDLCAAGLGNEHDQVGRYMMNHPKNYCGLLHLAEPVEELPYYFGALYAGFAGYAGLRLSECVQRERELLNAYVRFEPLFPWSDNQGIEALVLLVKRSRFVLDSWKSRRRGDFVSLRDYSETGDDSDLQNERKNAWGWATLFGKVLIHLPRVAQYLWFRLSNARPRVRTVRIRNFMEMEPQPENRVVLSAELDVHGQPLPLVRHQTTDLDRRSLVALHDELALEVEASGLGRLESDLASADPWPITLDASHHMGTTRMGSDPAHSVVDENCRLHDVRNVYLAGSSVFPTSGCANPTFTIVALSIRLARHLEREVLGAERAP